MKEEPRRRAAVDRIMRLFHLALTRYRLTPMILLAGNDRTGELKVIHPEGMTTGTVRQLLRGAQGVLTDSRGPELIRLPDSEEGGGA